MSKFYAVKKGRQPGIYHSWGEAQQQISGFSGAQFKSFMTKNEAEQYIKDDSEQIKKTEFEAYVDGSFNKTKQVYGSGVVILQHEQVIKELSLKGSDPQFIESFQIAGEVFACIAAVQWAVDQKIEVLTIYYDYQGIESWAKKEWQANKAVSKEYVKQFNHLSTQCNVYFKKVKGHSGNQYNDRADELAKLAVR